MQVEGPYSITDIIKCQCGLSNQVKMRSPKKGKTAIMVENHWNMKDENGRAWGLTFPHEQVHLWGKELAFFQWSCWLRYAASSWSFLVCLQCSDHHIPCDCRLLSHIWSQEGLHYCSKIETILSHTFQHSWNIFLSCTYIYESLDIDSFSYVREKWQTHKTSTSSKQMSVVDRSTGFTSEVS